MKWEEYNMKKPLLIPTLLISGLLLNSCNLFSSGNQSESNPSNSVSNQQTESSSEQSEAEEATAEATESLEPIQSEVSSIAGLKRATDPDDFVQRRGVTPSKNRDDPFTLFSVPPQQQPPQPSQEKTASAPSTQPATPAEAVQPEDSQSRSENPPQPKASPEPEKPSQPKASPEPEKPSQPKASPEPKLARGVTIQGAIQIGNEAFIISKAPNEKTSRYVRSGQFIANGQVLVKQINMKERPTPTVVLKEVGIEEQVVKTVEKEIAVGKTTAKNNESTMKLPPPSPQINSLSQVSAKP